MNDVTYRVVVNHEDGAWLADVPDLPGAHTYARTLPALAKAVREVVVLAADLPDEAMDSVRLDWEFHTGDAELDKETARVRALRDRAEKITTEAAERTATLARALVAHGTSVRDAAALLGVSAQRISQVTSQRHAADSRQRRAG